jgi:hypothetical protein
LLLQAPKITMPPAGGIVINYIVSFKAGYCPKTNT